MFRHSDRSIRAATTAIAVACLSGFAAERVAASAKDFPRTVNPAPIKSDWDKPVVDRLANGVQFAILSRRGSEPGVGLLMRNEGGFIAERCPGERGLAHLIEHVAFHSPTLAAPDDFDHLPHVGLGLTFPAPNAGSTSWRETNYYLATKSTATTSLDTLLTLFRDVASGMTLRADAVDISRREVMREMADKKLGNEIYASYVASVAPGSPNDVIDAQNSDDVPTASIETIRGLYRRLYHPENTMIVVVGNVKADDVRALIEKRFGDWKRSAAPTRRPSYPGFQQDRIQPISFSALEKGRRAVVNTVVMPKPARPASRDRQTQQEIMDLLVTRGVNDRLVALQQVGLPGKVGIRIENGDQGFRQIALWDNYEAGQWAAAVAGLRKTTCELATSGFTASEWEGAKRGLIADLQRRTAEMPKVANVQLAKDLSHAVADGRWLIPPDELLRRAETVLPRISVRSGSQWWRAQWRGGIEQVRVEGPELAGLPTPLAAIRTTANGAVNTPDCMLQ